MKKIEYMAPEMEIVKMKYQTNLLSMSEGTAPDPNDPQPGPF